MALGCGLAGQAHAQDETSVDDLIVTGTRVTGLRASDSPAPIQVVSEAALARTTATDFVNALAPWRSIPPSHRSASTAASTTRGSATGFRP